MADDRLPIVRAHHAGLSVRSAISASAGYHQVSENTVFWEHRPSSLAKYNLPFTQRENGSC